MSEEKKPARKKIAASGEMRKLMADYFYELDEAAKSGDKKVAWCTSVGPAEILRSMGFYVYFPENHAAISCVGCGRCTRSCPMGIGIEEVAASLQPAGADDE